MMGRTLRLRQLAKPLKEALAVSIADRTMNVFARMSREESKLEKLARPLPEARKNPKVDKAVLFVEDLFGRKMKNQDTKILLVSDKNRSGYIDAVKHDPKYLVSKRITGSILLFIEPRIISLLSERKAQEYFPEEYHVSLSRFIKWIEKDLNNSDRKKILEVMGELNPDLSEKIFGLAESMGLYFSAENIIIARDESVSILVHELIHAEDKNIWGLDDPLKKLMSDMKNPVEETISEGRAYYGEYLYKKIEDGMDFDATQILMEIRGESMLGSNGIIKRNLLPLWNGLDREDVRKIARTAIINFFRDIRKTGWYWHKQKKYIPFKIAIAELAHILNDPYAAFRITTEKQPRTMEELKNFKEFYKEEIEKYQRLN